MPTFTKVQNTFVLFFYESLSACMEEVHDEGHQVLLHDDLFSRIICYHPRAGSPAGIVPGLERQSGE